MDVEHVILLFSILPISACLQWITFIFPTSQMLDAFILFQHLV